MLSALPRLLPLSVCCATHPSETPLPPHLYAVNVLKAIQGCPTVCRIYCATANPTAVVIGKDGSERRGILGEVWG